MWIFASQGFLSIKQHDLNPALLVVRGRVRGDIQRLMSCKAVIEDHDADYRYRAFLDRDRVADRIAEHVRAINYGGSCGGFKSAIADRLRMPTYFAVWDEMYRLQEQLA